MAATWMSQECGADRKGKRYHETMVIRTRRLVKCPGPLEAICTWNGIKVLFKNEEEHHHTQDCCKTRRSKPTHLYDDIFQESPSLARFGTNSCTPSPQA